MNTISELLSQAKAAYLNALSTHRDKLLESGRLLHKYVLEYLKEGDNLTSETQRWKNNKVREKAVSLAATEFGVAANHISRLIGTAMVVELLGDPGRLAWTSINEFRKCIKRRTCFAKNHSQRRKLAASDGETWRLINGDLTRVLFRQAVTEKWNKKKTRAEVLSIIPEEKRMKCERQHKTQQSKHRNPATHREFKSESIAEQQLQAAKLASPGDVAEMCLKLVLAAEEPYAVAQRLISALDAIKKPKKKCSGV